MNTELEYCYRDADNYKISTTVVLAGGFSGADLELLAARLDEGDGFIPSQVGLRDLQPGLASFGDGLLSNADHVWHTLDLPADASTTSSSATVAISWAELVAAFAAVEWDVDEAVSRLGIPEGH